MEQESARVQSQCRQTREESEAALKWYKDTGTLFELLHNPKAVSDNSFRSLENLIIDLKIRRTHEKYRCRYLTDPSMPKSMIKKIKEEVDTYLERLINDGEDQPKPS